MAQQLGKARSIGAQLGMSLGLDHARLGPSARLQDAGLTRLAWLAWRYEPHGLPAYRYLGWRFAEGYALGYRRAWSDTVPDQGRRYFSCGDD